MRKLAFGILLLGLSGCGLASFWSAPSSLPTAKTLIADCEAGLAKTPPVRSNSCDVYNMLQTQCLQQAALPINAVQACLAAGYAIQGPFAPL